MKILYITQYFYPEIGAPTNRALANVRYLANQGHEVTVLTEMPNHPKGVIFKGYRGKIFLKEEIENFIVHRVWIFTSAHKNFASRILFYLTFPFMGILHSIFHWNNYDVLYISSPPLFVGIIGIFFRKLSGKIKFIFEVRDLWPAAAIEMGALTNQKMINFSYKLENSIYRAADHIVCVTNSFKEEITTKGYKEDSISVLRNGSDLNFKKVDIPEAFYRKYDKENNFILIYAGNLGIAQNLTILLKAAKKLRDKNVLFIILGTGVEEKLLKIFAAGSNLDNVIFTGEIAQENVNEYLSLADIGIIPLKKIDVFKRTIPSKLFDYMSANLPVLLGVEGEAREILLESKAGITFEPDNVDDLVEKILLLQSDEKSRKVYAANGRKFVENNYNREVLAARLEEIIYKVINSEENQ
jgi:glycosyltransferase involved in cell wall biosynthesis